MIQQRQELTEVDSSLFTSARISLSILIGFAILIVLQSGCSVYHLTKRTLHTELNEYPQTTEAKRACREYQRWAKQEWHRASNEFDVPPSRDYASGFLQGFVDQVYGGGETSAPPIPPRKYWRVGYRDANGRQAIDDWYHGFEHGAEVAQVGGYRDRAVVPSSLVAGSGADLRLREGFDDEPVIVPDEQEVEEIETPVPTPAALSMEDFPATGGGNSKEPPAFLPISFESAKPIQESDGETTWGDEPPRPPWQQELSDAETNLPAEILPISGPVTPDSVMQTSAEQDDELPSETSSPNVNDEEVGTGLLLNAPRQSEAEEEPFREVPSGPWNPSTPTDAGSNKTETKTEAENGRESISEPTLWQSRD